VVTPADRLRAEAEALAAQLPDLALRAKAAESRQIGSAARRRAGSGEQFWQYRRHVDEDSADRVDWRRSARGDDLFVRESELETSRTVLFWCDDDAGFRWKAERDTRTKAEAAQVLMLTAAILVSGEGERVGALGTGRTPGLGKRAIDRLAEDLLRGTNGRFPEAPKKGATVVIASDFYDPVAAWQARLAPLAGRCPEGVLLAVASPVEIDFPFDGRVRLTRPGSAIERVVGRAETLRTEYAARFAAQRGALVDLAARMNWRFVAHTTGTGELAGAAALTAQLESFGVRA
jgi:uncharacterized protein (DUF58 family)